ncbi:MAG: LD-carboxypeptidase [Bacteroidales bacterium]|nr:LD-carboxypeptidase [Bacteroidales bacterium]
MKKIIPQALKHGDKIGIVAPAGYVSAEQIKSAAKKVEKAGFVPVIAENIFSKHGYLSGTDEERAFQLNSFFKRSDIKAVIAARGGYGCSRILDLIDYESIIRNPKILGGYSDITALVLAVYKKTGLVTFHSSMLIPEDTAYTRNSMWEIFQNGKKGFLICPQKNDETEVLRHGKASGILLGGNLTLLETLIGTKYDFSLYNKILFIEEINEPPYKVDRMLTHLKNAKDFSGLKGLIFGKMKGCEAQGENSLPLDYVVNDFCKNLKIPVIKNFSFGHVNDRCTLPIGVKVEIDTENFQIRLLENCVE